MATHLASTSGGSSGEFMAALPAHRATSTRRMGTASCVTTASRSRRAQQLRFTSSAHSCCRYKCQPFTGGPAHTGDCVALMCSSGGAAAGTLNTMASHLIGMAPCWSIKSDCGQVQGMMLSKLRPGTVQPLSSSAGASTVSSASAASCSTTSIVTCFPNNNVTGR